MSTFLLVLKWWVFGWVFYEVFFVVFAAEVYIECLLKYLPARFFLWPLLFWHAVSDMIKAWKTYHRIEIWWLR